MIALLSELSKRDIILLAFASSLLAREAFSWVLAHLLRKQREIMSKRVDDISKQQCLNSACTALVSLRCDSLSRRLDALSKRCDHLTDDGK